MIDPREQTEMANLAREVKLKFHRDAKVLVFCVLSSMSFRTWTARVEHGKKFEEASGKDPLEALKDLLSYLCEEKHVFKF
jgi:hypothetical protein